MLNLASTGVLSFVSFLVSDENRIPPYGQSQAGYHRD